MDLYNNSRAAAAAAAEAGGEVTPDTALMQFGLYTKLRGRSWIVY